MGAWSHGHFDNDAAMDWLGELAASEGTQPISEAFEAVLEGEGEYLEAPEASAALAAAEVVAILLGKPAARQPEVITAWLARQRPPKTGLVKMAQRVVKRILKDSELKDLWAESADSTKWEQEVQELLQRLTTNPA